MLMVSTTEGMLDGIHSNTTNLWPAVSLDLVFMVSTTSLEKRLVDTTTTSNNTDGSAASRVKDFLGSRWKLDASLSSIGVVRDYHSRITRCFSKNTSVTDFVFDAATSGTFGHFSDWENISNVESSLVTTVDGLTGSCTFCSDEGRCDFAVFIRILESDLQKWSTTTRVMNDILDNALDETMSFSKVH